MTADFGILRSMVFGARGGTNHAERLSAFYAPQAGDYDRFREKLLPGRRELVWRLDPADGESWLDMGGGTAITLEFMGERAASLSRYMVVDLCTPLLEEAGRRILRHRLKNAEAVVGDATSFLPPSGRVDVVLFSYSLSMIPDWVAAVSNARDLLKPGGRIGVVDFYTSGELAIPGRAHHGRFTRGFWPRWFAWDGVHLRDEVLPKLIESFETISVTENMTRLPYLPGSRVPWFQFIGRKAAVPPCPQSLRGADHERRCGQVAGAA